MDVDKLRRLDVLGRELAKVDLVETGRWILSVLRMHDGNGMMSTHITLWN